MAKAKSPKSAAAKSNGSKSKKVLSRSEAVAATWNDPKVRAARAERTAVRVKGYDYRSVGAAFADLGLPDGSMVRFRAALKASPTGRATFEAADGSKFQFTALAAA